MLARHWVTWHVRICRGTLRKMTSYAFFVSFLASPVSAGRSLHAQTIPVKDSHGVQGIYEASVVGSRLFFCADDTELGAELWVSDGTPDGTRLVVDLNPGPIGSNPFGLTKFGDRLFFRGGWSAAWITDGSAEGTVPVSNLRSGYCTIVAVGERVFFNGYDGQSVQQLWVTDGTPEGTRLVKDLNPGSSGSEYLCLRAAGDRVFFAGDDGQSGRELWVSDGTPKATILVKDIVQGSGSSDPSDLTAVGGLLFFIASEVVHEYKLWVSDGTPGGTNPIKQLIPRQNFSGGLQPAEFLTPVGNRLFFVAFDDEGNRELWVSDATPQGTHFLMRVDLGQEQLWPVGERLFFTDRGPDGSVLPWISDGTAKGTKTANALVSAPGPLKFGFGSVHSSFTVVGDRTYFTANVGDEFGLWETDWTPEGTSRIADLGYFFCRGDGAKYCPSPLLIPLRDKLLFTSDGGMRLSALSIESAQFFHRGDPNSSGTTDISDALTIFGHLFLGDTALSCRETADVNNDGTIDISDGINLLNWLFLGGPEPVTPGPTDVDCGLDPDPPGSPGELGCEEYGHCS